MFRGLAISVIMPALNEEAAIGPVLREIPPWVDEVIVVDNGSTDRTAEVAASLGARVVTEPRRGYGQACLTGLAALREADIVVFLDADHSDYPDDMERLVAPVADGRADMVIGSRTLAAEPCEATHTPATPASPSRRINYRGMMTAAALRGLRAWVAPRSALTIQQRAGNALACWLMRRRYSARHTDLGPFRAIRRQALDELDMDDRSFGWTIQMQIRARARGLTVLEAPVRYRQRIGRSKISGTLSGCVRAGARILETVLREPVIQPRCPSAGQQRLIVFARLPRPGATKTRLIPALGAEGAAELHRQMTLRTLAVADDFARSRPNVSVEIRFTGGSAEEMADLYGDRRRYIPQASGDLGARMNAAATEALGDSARSVILIGTDCPGLDALTLDAAFTRLATADLVLGPAADGGYYLVGLRQPASALFQSIDWGTSRVLKQTLTAARREPLKVAMLHRLHDVDEPEDLAIWEHSATSPPQGARLSIVIPALNEEAHIGATIDAARAGAPLADIEIIVCDGGSTDATIAIARSRGATVVPGDAARGGRGTQMNLGARIASGDLLLFLHADTSLPPAWDAHVRAHLAEPAVAAGAFCLSADPSGPGMRLIQAGANFRSRLLSLPYGDQAIFLRRSTFHAVGGFPDFPAMEDFEMMRRLRRLGRIAIAPAAVRTSARRWRRGGVVRTTLLNQFCIAAYLAGASPSRIAAWRRSSALPQTPAPRAPRPQPTRGT